MQAIEGGAIEFGRLLKLLIMQAIEGGAIEAVDNAGY
jgi:hypothetical protein